MASLGGIDAYMEQWLKTATKGNVRFTMAFLTNRMHLHCDVCNVGLSCEKPVDANTIDYAVQEYVKLHAHKGDKWKCELCGEWTHEPSTGPSGHGTTCTAVVKNGDSCSHKKIDGTTALLKLKMLNGDIWVRCTKCGAQMKPVTVDFKDLPSKQPLPMATGGQSAVIDENPQNAAYDKSQLADYQLAKKIAELQLGDKQLKQVPTVVEHTPPPPKSAPVSDVFEDKGRKFR